MESEEGDCVFGRNKWEGGNGDGGVKGGLGIRIGWG